MPTTTPNDRVQELGDFQIIAAKWDGYAQSWWFLDMKDSHRAAFKVYATDHNTAKEKLKTLLVVARMKGKRL